MTAAAPLDTDYGRRSSKNYVGTHDVFIDSQCICNAAHDSAAAVELYLLAIFMALIYSGDIY